MISHSNLSSKPLWTDPGLERKWRVRAISGAYLYSADSLHGNLHQLSVLMRRVTYFYSAFYIFTQEPVLVTAKTGTGEEVLQKMQMNGPEG